MSMPTGPELRELIHFAAKAFFGPYYCGKVIWTQMAHGGYWEALTATMRGAEMGWQRFDPIRMHDDAFMLMTKLHIPVEPDEDGCTIRMGGLVFGSPQIREDAKSYTGFDALSQATMMAITRAAAVVGRQMP